MSLSSSSFLPQLPSSALVVKESDDDVRISHDDDDRVLIGSIRKDRNDSVQSIPKGLIPKAPPRVTSLWPRSKSKSRPPPFPPMLSSVPNVGNSTDTTMTTTISTFTSSQRGSVANPNKASVSSPLRMSSSVMGTNRSLKVDHNAAQVVSTWPSPSRTSVRDSTPWALRRIQDFIATETAKERDLRDQWDLYLAVLTKVGDGLQQYAPLLASVRDYFASVRAIFLEDARLNAEAAFADRMEEQSSRFRELFERQKSLHQKEVSELQSQLSDLRTFQAIHIEGEDKRLQQAREDVKTTKSIVMESIVEAEHLRSTLATLNTLNQELKAEIKRLQAKLDEAERRNAMGAYTAHTSYLPEEIITSSRDELTDARLSTQQILVQHASTQFLAARQLLDHQQNEITKLRTESAVLRTELEHWQKKCHTKRFRPMEDDDGDSVGVPLTPRAYLPLELYDRHGIAILDRPTAAVVSDMISLIDEQSETIKDSYNEGRRLKRLTSWIDDGLVAKVQSMAGPEVIPFMSEDDFVPEFLRHRNRCVGEWGVQNEDWGQRKTMQMVSDIVHNAEQLRSKIISEWNDEERDAAARSATMMGASSNGGVESPSTRLGIDPRKCRLATPLDDLLYVSKDHLLTRHDVITDPNLMPFDHIVCKYLRDRFSSIAEPAHNLSHNVKALSDAGNPMAVMFTKLIAGQMPLSEVVAMRSSVQQLRNALKLADIERNGKLSVSTVRNILLQFFMDQPNRQWVMLQRGMWLTVNSAAGPQAVGVVPLQRILEEDSTTEQGPSPLLVEIRRHVLKINEDMYLQLEAALEALVVDSQNGVAVVPLPEAREASKAISSQPRRTVKGPPAPLKLESYVETVARDLPRHSRLMPVTKTVRSKKRGKVVEEKVTTMVPQADCVEWSYFLHRMRLTPLPFRDLLHTQECSVGEFGLTLKKIASDVAIPAPEREANKEKQT